MRARVLVILAAAAASALVWWAGRPPSAPAPAAPPLAAPADPGGVAHDGPEASPALPEAVGPSLAPAPPPGGSVPGSPRSAPAEHGEEGFGVASRVPHRVLRAWGAARAAGGARELRLVVEPSLGTGELERLLRDVVSQNSDAEILTVRIYDSEEAVRYDRHLDGGALAERHLVADATRHRELGVESLRLRGIEIGP